MRGIVFSCTGWSTRQSSRKCGAGSIKSRRMRRRCPPASPAHKRPASRLHRDLQPQAGPQERGLDQAARRRTRRGDHERMASEVSEVGASSPPARDHAAPSAFDPTRTAARTSNRAGAPPGTEPPGPARPRATDRTTPCRAGFAPREPGTGTPQLPPPENRVILTVSSDTTTKLPGMSLPCPRRSFSRTAFLFAGRSSSIRSKTTPA